MLGGFLGLRGMRAGGSLVGTLWRGAPAASSERRTQLADLAVLERLAVLGGCLGLLLGTTGAIANWHTPERIGPGLASGLSSVVIATLAVLLFVLPMRHRLAFGIDGAGALPARAVASRMLYAFGVVALVVAGLSLAAGAPETPAAGNPHLSVPNLILVLAAVVPSLCAAPAAIFAGALTRYRLRALADAMWAATALTVACNLMQTFARLDHPDFPGTVAGTFASIGLPATLATWLRLQSATVPAGGEDGSADGGSWLPAFAAICCLAMAAMVVFVTIVGFGAPRS